jgi:hypothetical protein
VRADDPPGATQETARARSVSVGVCSIRLRGRKGSGSRLPRVTMRAVLAVAAAAVSLSGCEEEETGGGSGAPAEDAPAEERAAKPTPISCLEEAGLSGVQQRAKNLWRGFTSEGTVVLVDKLESKAEVRRAVRQADLVVSEAVGRFFVHGPLLDADDGSTAAVAACLRGG